MLGGSKGHVATFDWTQQKLGCELQLKESVRDVQYVRPSLLLLLHGQRL